MFAKVNVSAALEIVSQLELWDKFQGGNEVSITEIAALTGADEIIISEHSIPRRSKLPVIFY